MRIPLLVTLPLLAVLAGLGWHNQRRIGELRADHEQLVARAANHGHSFNPAAPDDSAWLTKRPRPDRVAEAKLVAAGLVAYAAEPSLPEGTDPEVKSRRVLEETERVQSLNGSQLKILIAELQGTVDMEAATRISFLRFAIGQLIKTDPQSALAILLADPTLDPPTYSQAQHLFADSIRIWASSDPAAAQSWLHENRNGLGEQNATAVQVAWIDVVANADPLLALSLLSGSELELRELPMLIESSNLSPEKRSVFRAAWHERTGTRPEFPVPHAAQTAQPPDAVEHPVAKPVPGNKGFVFSPFNNKIVDARGMSSGMLVADPSAPPTEKWIFRLP